MKFLDIVRITGYSEFLFSMDQNSSLIVTENGLSLMFLGRNIGKLTKEEIESLDMQISESEKHVELKFFSNKKQRKIEVYYSNLIKRGVVN